MSSLAQAMALTEQPHESFDARLTLADGVGVFITAPTMGALAEVVARLRPVAGVTTRKAPAPKPDAASPVTAKEELGNASASTGTQGSAPPADSGSGASAGDELPAKTPAELFKAVGERVNALSAKSRDLAKAELKKFGVERGSLLSDEQKAAFLKATEALVQ